MNSRQLAPNVGECALATRLRPCVQGAFAVLLWLLVSACEESGIRYPRIVVTPTAAVLQPGQSRVLKAWRVTGEGQAEDVTSAVEWSVLKAGIASVSTDSDGDVSVAGVEPGMTTVSATLRGKRGYALLSVSKRQRRLSQLRVNSGAPRYFADEAGRPVYLTGSHTWSALQDNGRSDPPAPFDYDSYLDTLQGHGHNFFRLWSWEQGSYVTDLEGPYWIKPNPYKRTGPGLAIDGQARYDLRQFDEQYFQRLRERVMKAGERQIYVSVMLFDGWSVNSRGRNLDNPWKGHPFNESNNINGVNGDADGDGAGLEVHRMVSPVVLAFQEAYVRKVIDSVHDLDNLLYEISNESQGGSAQWQYHMIDYIRQYEARLGKRHPIGMTVERPGESNDALFESKADWVAPWRFSPLPLEPVPNHSSKVIVYDTDHACGVCGTVPWVWKTLLTGGNPLLMDSYDGQAIGLGALDNRKKPVEWELIRRNLGYARVFAETMDLASAEPLNALASTGYCLASPSSASPEYLVLLPEGGSVYVDISTARDSLSVQWLDPLTGELRIQPPIPGGAPRTFETPFAGISVLYLSARSR